MCGDTIALDPYMVFVCSKSVHQASLMNQLVCHSFLQKYNMVANYHIVSFFVLTFFWFSLAFYSVRSHFMNLNVDYVTVLRIAIAKKEWLEGRKQIWDSLLEQNRQNATIFSF